jgi:hypothetical protein
MKQGDSVVPFPGADPSSLPDHLLPSIRIDTPELLELRRRRTGRKRGGKFVLGPIWLDWIGVCQQANPGALALALGIRAYAKMRGGAAPVGDALGRQVGLDPRQRRRALAALEAAGLVRVERRPGHAPLATVRPWAAKRPES